MQRKNEARWIESRQRWQINVQAEGERRTFTSSVPGTKGKVAAERKADEWLSSFLNSENTPAGKLMDGYVEAVKGRSTGAAYEQNEKFVRLYIKPVIGAKKMSRITAGDLQDVLDRCYSQKHLSAKTIKGVRGTISGWLKWCRMHKYSSLVAEGLSIPVGAAPSKRTILMPDALETLFAISTTTSHRKIKDEPYIWAFRFAVVTGLRPGEIVGLQNSDIKDNRYIIRRAINEDGKITSGKNDNARRSGELSEIANWILEQQRISLAQAGHLSKFVFPDEDGDYISQKKYYSHWKRYCAYHGIEEGTKPYELRHTFCSVNDEMPDGLKKRIMGHSKSMDTEGVYGHLKAGDLQRAAGYIDAAFSSYIKK